MTKVSAVIAHSQYYVDSASKLGAVDAGDLASYSQPGTSGVVAMIGNGGTEDSQIIPFSYTVPFNKQAIVQTLQISASVLSIWEDTNTGGDYARASGKAYVNIAGSQVSEEKLWSKQRVLSGGSSSQLGDNSGAGGPVCTPKQFGRVPFFGDGIQMTNGQVFSVTYDPQTAGSGVGIFPHVVHAWMHGKDTVTGAPIHVKGDLVPPDATTGQTVLTYTVGANGITILHWMVWAEGSPPFMFDAPELYHNGQKFAEGPQVTWTIDRSKGMHIIYPLWGVTLGHNETIHVKVRPFTALGQLFNTVLYGEEKPTGFPRRRAR